MGPRLVTSWRAALNIGGRYPPDHASDGLIATRKEALIRRAGLGAVTVLIPLALVFPKVARTGNLRKPTKRSDRCPNLI